MNTKALSDIRRVVSRKPWPMIIIGVLIVTGLWAFWQYLTNPPRPWIVRWQVSRYLKKNATLGPMKIDFAFPSKAEMAKAPPKPKQNPALLKGSRTGKDFDTLASEYLELKTAAVILEREIAESAPELQEKKPLLEQLTRRLAEARQAGATNVAVLEAQVNTLQKRLAALEEKAVAGPELQQMEQKLVPMVADLWDFQRRWDEEMRAYEASGASTLVRAGQQFEEDIRRQIGEALSYEAIYKLIGQELWVAERLLDSKNPEHRRVGLSLALDASHRAIDDAVNGWLGARICEGYVWPNLDLADDTNRRSPFHLENLLNECARIFRSNDEFPALVRNYKIMLAKADTPREADAARAQIAMAHEQSGNLKAAIQQLRDIKNTNDFRWVLWRIPRMEQQLKGR